MTTKILLTTLLFLTLLKGKSQTNIVADTITNWQVYLGDNKILFENEIDLKVNGVKVIKVKKADLESNKYLRLNINTCIKTKNRYVEIQFGNGKNRYTTRVFKIDKLKISSKFILDILDYRKTNQVILSLNYPPFLQPNGVQYGLFLVDLRLE